jgi:opacity protein-like surface antigen
MTTAAALAGMLLTASSGAAQELADFDYENLTFRGFGAEWGYIWPDRVEPTQSFGVRMDLGYLGPGLRIVPSVHYWTSTFKASEVQELEDRVESLIVDQTGDPPPSVDLGVIDWSDLSLAVDAQVVWRVPYGVLTFAGLGVGAHVLNGAGNAIDDTFIEDLLDSVAAGFNVHGGLELPVSPRLRLDAQARYEVMGDLRYAQIRLGGQFMIGAPAPGEERRQ